MLEITPLYAGLLALLFLALSGRVILHRIAENISLGDGGDAGMARRIRVQANCAEYAPFGIILLAMAEVQGMPGWLVHIFGSMLFLGRVIHAWGLGASPQILSARRLGMGLTITRIAITAVANIGHALF